MSARLIWRGSVLVTLAVAICSAQNNQRVAVMRSRDPILLDGRLDEPVWQRASVLTLIQQSPHPRESTPYATEARIVLAGDRIYFGILCRDPEPRRIVVHNLQRDDPMTGDDSVSIALDTYGDKRTGYFFKVNAAGRRTDGLISSPDGPAYDWDGIWDAHVAVLDNGWSAEIMIPARTLSFTPGLDAWGLNIERFIAREGSIVLRWNSPTLDSLFCDMSRAGLVTGFAELRQGLGIEFSSFTIGRTKTGFPNLYALGKAPRAPISPGRLPRNWSRSFTANTDFVETEVDSRQINITRLPLFFPEKRSFFLEGSNQYVFGLGLSDALIPFFSRRVGLLDGQPIPIDAGVKLNARVGKWNLALLDVQTRETKASSGVVPAVNLLAARVSYDITSEFRVGTIFTNGDPLGRKRNTLVGFDAVYRTSKFLKNKNLQVGAWGAKVAGDLHSGNRTGWGARIDYPNDLFDCSASVNQFGDAFWRHWRSSRGPAHVRAISIAASSPALRKPAVCAGSGRSSWRTSIPRLSMQPALRNRGSTASLR